MNDSLILLQLAFNVLMFTALAALAWRSFPARRPAVERRQAKAAEKIPTARSLAVAASAAPPLDDLIARADASEQLAAEAALRARLAAFRERAS